MRRACLMAAGPPKMPSVPKLPRPRRASMAAGHPLMPSGPIDVLPSQGIYGQPAINRVYEPQRAMRRACRMAELSPNLGDGRGQAAAV